MTGQLARPIWGVAHNMDDLQSQPAAEASSPQAADAVLLDRLAAGDEAAFNEIVDRHFSLVFRIVARVLGTAADAEDVTQEAFLKLWRAPPTLRNPSALKSWIVRVGRNLAIDRLRRERPASDDGLELLQDETTAPDGELRHMQAAEQVRASMAALPERQRTALQLTYYEAFGNQATAEIMDISVEAVESLLSRARRTLRQSLDGQWKDLVEELEQLK